MNYWFIYKCPVLEQAYLHLSLDMQDSKCYIYIHTTGLKINYLQIYYEIWIHICMPYWPRSGPFVLQLMVPSYSGLSFFGSRLIMYCRGISINLPLLLSVLRGFGPGDYHFHLRVVHSLSGEQSSKHLLDLVALAIWFHINNLSLSQHQPLPYIFSTSWSRYDRSSGSICIQWGYHCTWLLLGIFCNHTDCWWTHCHAEFCCELLPLSEMTSFMSLYSKMIDFR